VNGSGGCKLQAGKALDIESGLNGRRVLIVEDEMLVSMLVEDILLDFGCTVVGTAARLADAMELARTSEIDVALLDINLGGNRSFPVAEILAERGVPFVFASGIIQKPFSPDAIGNVLLSCLTAEA
jgi:DNA-binding NarL/FixJ family response regulator